VHYTGSGLDLPPPTVEVYAEHLFKLIREFPLAEVSLGDCRVIDFDGDLNLPPPKKGCGKGWDALLDRLDDLRETEDPDGVYVALLPDEAVQDVLPQGCGRKTGVAACTLGSRKFIHEVGHTMRRKHAPCGDPDNPDEDFPDYGFGDAAIGEYSVDIEASAQLAYPPTRADIMSYCQLGSQRVSPYTFEGVRQAMLDRWGDPTAQQAGVSGVERELLTLRFDVDGDRVTLRSSHRRMGRYWRPPGPPSPVTIDLVGDTGVLATHRCRLVSPFDRPGDAALSFSESIPWPEGTRELVIRRNGREIHRWPAAEEPADLMGPVAVSFDPGSGLLQWHEAGSAAPAGDSEDRDYQVEFSRDDGRTWRAIAHPRQPRLIIDPRRLPGGPQCRLRVATRRRGVVAARQVESPPTGAFAIPLAPRRVHLLTPRPGQTVPPTVLLSGGGYAPGQGLAEAADTVWTSDRDGPLGTGHQVLAQLSPGPHRLTLSLPDGLGGTATEFVDVQAATGPWETTETIHANREHNQM
jgi:hypothetical protein